MLAPEVCRITPHAQGARSICNGETGPGRCDVDISVNVPMVYSRQMRDLMPPRTFSVTFAAVLAILIGFFWLAAGVGLLIEERRPGVLHSGLRLEGTGAFLLLSCVSAGALIGGFGTLFRRNWARILAIAAAVPLMFFGALFLFPFVRFPALLMYAYSKGAFSILLLFLPFPAAIAWPLMLIGRKVRAEFLPPAIVEIYVNLLDEGTPCRRQTQALTLGNGLFELLPTERYNPEDEHWEFRPGSIVRGKVIQRDDEPYLLATSFER